mgnify:CR=1 FL=1
MKKNNLVFIIFILILSSCSSDGSSSSNSVNSGGLIGEWEMVDYLLSGTTEVTDQDGTVISEVLSKGLDYNHTITFSENPNDFIAEGDFSVETTTTTNGEASTEILEAQSFGSICDGLGTWEMIDDELITTNENNEIVIMKVEELNTSSLVLSTSEKRNISAFGSTLKIDINITVSFEKK